MKTALGVAVVLSMIGAASAVAQTVANTSQPPQPPAVSTTNPDWKTADTLKALGCTVGAAAERDRCAR